MFKGKSIGQLNVERIGRKTFARCSENATDALPQYSRKYIYSNQSALVSQ